MASKKSIKAGLSEFVPTEEEEEGGGDPFAIDFFSQTNYALEEDKPEDPPAAENNLDGSSAAVNRRLWNADLPQIAVSELNQKLFLTQLPEDLATTVCKISTNNLSQIILQNPAAARCEIISTVETDYSEEVLKLKPEQAVCLSFVVEPQQAPAALILDAVFAVKVIETSLSSEATANERRALSKTELSVLEFLSLNCLKDINNYFLEPLFRWQAITQGEINSVLKRGLLVNIRIQIGEIADIAKLLLPFGFLQSLSQRDNPLLARRNRGGNLIGLSRLVSGVRLHVVLGETIIDAGEMAVLESGDVILVEHPLVLLANSKLKGAVQIRVGDEAYESLYGDLSTSESLQFQLREVSQRNITEPMRSMMPENQTESQSLEQTTNRATDLSPDEADVEELNDGALALEKVTVKISVELVSRRISLSELANIHIGQIIELGSRATDPVELVADGRAIAIGELIDIEGNLGVRLIRVLL